MGCFDLLLVTEFLEEHYELFQEYLSDQDIEETEAEVIIDELRGMRSQAASQPSSAAVMVGIGRRPKKSDPGEQIDGNTADGHILPPCR